MQLCKFDHTRIHTTSTERLESTHSLSERRVRAAGGAAMRALAGVAHMHYLILARCALWRRGARRLFYPKAFKLEIWPCMLMRAAPPPLSLLAAHINGEHVARNKVRQHSRPTWREFQITLRQQHTHTHISAACKWITRRTYRRQPRSKINAAASYRARRRVTIADFKPAAHGMIEFSIRSEIKERLGSLFSCQRGLPFGL